MGSCLTDSVEQSGGTIRVYLRVLSKRSPPARGVIRTSIDLNPLFASNSENAGQGHDLVVSADLSHRF